MATTFPQSKLSEKAQRKSYDLSWEVTHNHFFNVLGATQVISIQYVQGYEYQEAVSDL